MIKLVAHWPFLSYQSKMDDEARAAVEKFERVEKRALRLDRLKDGIGEVAAEARAMQQSQPDASG